MLRDDWANYQAAYTDRDDPGYYLLEYWPDGDPGRGVELLQVPEPELRGRALIVAYTLLPGGQHEGLTDADAQALIVGPLLAGFLGGDFEARADRITFVDARTGARREAAYERGWIY